MKLLPALRDFALTLAPELRRLYVAHSPADYPWPNDCGGLAALYTDWTLRDALKAAGVWEGPAPIVLIAEPTGEDRGGLFSHERQMIVVLLHELAHCLPARIMPADREPSPPERDIQAKQLARQCASDGMTDRPPWEWSGDHGAKFIRRALHLHARAWLAGYAVPLSSGLCAGGWHLSDPTHYMAALAGEPIDLRRATFGEIERTPMPLLFTELWESDVAAYHRRHQALEEAAA